MAFEEDRDMDSGVKSNSSRRILLVDDDEDVAHTLMMLLEYLGHHVRAEYRGEEVVSAAKQFHPEIILLDIGLPGINGYQVAQQIRAESELAGVALIAVTGYSGDVHARRAREAGFDHHLVKPIRMASLESLIHQVHPVGSSR